MFLLEVQRHLPALLFNQETAKPSAWKIYHTFMFAHLRELAKCIGPHCSEATHQG